MHAWQAYDRPQLTQEEDYIYGILLDSWASTQSGDFTAPL